ncbi:hypothetical protein GUA87_07965 [Sneathiella sp. P13V-1]|uniref:hypothetical protein n=1 Tax=Sneathiella sp. P13V-1 TaxID=2697366 RepID=UPI00187B72C0|nr:hypothetical protein [Sneathiella sp. P13V-1]MBE7636776.1 hypothetical protein [Sneathiella sp. P13V-1]
MMSSKRLLVAACSALALSFTLPTISYSKQASTQSSERTGRIFSEAEKRIIEDFFKGKREEEEKTNKKASKGKKNKKGLPPGLAKRDELPPGLQKQLEKNGKLPPGLDKRELPSDLESRLPKLSETLERVIVGDDVLLIEKGVGLIFDILRGAAAK